MDLAVLAVIGGVVVLGLALFFLRRSDNGPGAPGGSPPPEAK